MTYRGQIAKGQIVLDEPVQLPEGATVQVQIIEPRIRITRPSQRRPLRKIQPIVMPGGSLADELVRDRR
jgi:hypothetical protein